MTKEQTEYKLSLLAQLVEAQLQIARELKKQRKISEEKWT
jgi:hypothetical protein